MVISIIRDIFWHFSDRWCFFFIYWFLSRHKLLWTIILLWKKGPFEALSCLLTKNLLRKAIKTACVSIRKKCPVTEAFAKSKISLNNKEKIFWHQKKFQLKVFLSTKFRNERPSEIRKEKQTFQWQKWQDKLFLKIKTNISTPFFPKISQLEAILWKINLR